MTTINYDLPVKDLVDALSATKHVTHESFTKTSVTLHHNGGVGVSHEGVLETWTTRAASAHFDVDSAGSIAQYVKIDEYAWATGNNTGNEESISIEMTDFTGDPNWEVSEVTWKAAARLAAWLFVHVIGARPSSANVFPHQHWTSTDCPGPFVMHNFSTIVGEIQAQYDHLVAPVSTPAPAPVPAPQRPTTIVGAPPISLHIVEMCARNDPGAPQGATTNYNQVIWVQKALMLEGLLSDSDKRWGRGSFGSMTRAAYAIWQSRLGYSGADADGIPGQTSLAKLGSKWGFHVIA